MCNVSMPLWVPPALALFGFPAENRKTIGLAQIFILLKFINARLVCICMFHYEHKIYNCYAYAKNRSATVSGKTHVKENF